MVYGMEALYLHPMNLMTILWIIFVLMFAKTTENVFGTSINNEYFSKDSSKNYRGIFILAIILHHIAQETSTGILFHSHFCNMGELSVAIFFFISGYGLQKSHITKKDYNKHFLAKRLPNILLPFSIIVLIRLIQCTCNGTIYSFKNILVNIVRGELIVPFSWYVVAITFFYIMFWMLMKVCRKHYFMMIIGASIGYIVYTILCIKVGNDIWWYLSTPAFILGMFWSTYEKYIDKELKERQWMYWILLIISLFFVILLFVKYDEIKNILTFTGAESLIVIVRNLLFSINFVLVTMKLKIGNKATTFFGEMSLELYLIQGVFIKEIDFGIKNEFLWCIFVLVSTIFVAYFFHKLDNALLSRYKNWLMHKVNKHTVKNEKVD